MANEGSRLFRTPEIGLSFLSFFLNFFWEVIRIYFYTVVSFWIVSMISPRWLLKLKWLNFIAFIAVGVFYTIFSEMINVQIFKSWGLQ